MHPDQLYIMAQQHAEQLRRQAEHARLSREIRRKTIEPFAPQFLRWLGFGSARPVAETDLPGMSTTTERPHENCGHTYRNEDDIDHGIEREASRA